MNLACCITQEYDSENNTSACRKSDGVISALILLTILFAGQFTVHIVQYASQKNVDKQNCKVHCHTAKHVYFTNTDHL